MRNASVRPVTLRIRSRTQVSGQYRTFVYRAATIIARAGSGRRRVCVAEIGLRFGAQVEAVGQHVVDAPALRRLDHVPEHAAVLVGVEFELGFDPGVAGDGRLL